jgi:hypothetical protein
MQTPAGTVTATKKSETTPSIAGQGQSCPKVPNLLQDIGNGDDYGRIKVGRKLIRKRPGISEIQSASTGLRGGV